MSSSLKGIAQQTPFPLRLPPSLRSRLEASAGLANRSLNAHINHLLERNLKDFPVLTETYAVTEPLSKVPYGLRMTDTLKSQLQAAARKSGCPLNTELVNRLQQAEMAGSTDVAAERPRDQHPGEPEDRAAWQRLSRAIESMLSASVFDLSRAAADVREAKAAYERLALVREYDWQRHGE